MFSKIGDILESGADLVESESAAAFQRLLRLGGAVAIMAALALVLAASTLGLLAGAVLVLEPALGLTPTLLGVSAAGLIIAGAVFWIAWRRTHRLLGARNESPQVRQAKQDLREAISGDAQETKSGPMGDCGSAAAKLAQTAMDNPDIVAAGCAAVIGLIGPGKAIKGAGKAAGAVSGVAAMMRLAKELGLLDQTNDNGQSQDRNAGASDAESNANPRHNGSAAATSGRI